MAEISATVCRGADFSAPERSAWGAVPAATARTTGQGAVAPKSRGKSVIMICLGGGPSQIDMYDMKPDAPVDYRGEFRPIKTNLPGFELCELMPRQAKLADKFSVVRNVQWVEPDHQRAEVFSGYPVKAHRPSFGSIVSRLYHAPDLKLPKFVSLSSEYNQELQTFEDPGYVGAAHRAFIPTRKGLENFALRPEITLDRLGDRKQLLQSLDNARRDLDNSEFAALDTFTAQALDMITSRNVREAFDIEREPRRTCRALRPQRREIRIQQITGALGIRGFYSRPAARRSGCAVRIPPSWIVGSPRRRPAGEHLSRLPHALAPARSIAQRAHR